MSREIRTVVDGMSFTECPRWHEDRLWFVDFYTHRVFSAAEDGTDLRTELEIPAQPSGLGWLPDGRLLAVSARDRRILRREADGSVVTHADLSDRVPAQLNDMVVDSTTGRAWVGNFGFDLMGGEAVAPTTVYRVDPDGSVTAAADDLWFPNGSVVAGGTLLVDETFGNRISAFDLHDDGSLGPRRDWASFGPLPTASDLETVLGGQLVVAPDGCSPTLDAEGCLWVADALGGRAVRVREGGEIVDAVEPGTGVYACGLGGSDGRTLYLCTAPDFLEHNRRDAREAAVQAVTVDVPSA
ncbi:SMP-30/gluconolactonase/LRE family protein [Actinomycetospora chiangmaiensis]|uniref:SMP-30/gluconolactonase/LRE family protein n=1 Tax=Actinomycetospora chiangmaiensis TaxID=402650 RepID=UPI000381F19F|nr:SMP-30/gluconolactonase/LRE family protein [Actinomycetospora chiangmaiensis]